MNQLIKWLDLYFGQKAPQLPGKAKEFLVKIAPWLAIIGVVLAIPAILAVFGFSRFAFSMMGSYGYMGYNGFGAQKGLLTLAEIETYLRNKPDSYKIIEI
jgi:hypothetical protein